MDLLLNWLLQGVLVAIAASAALRLMTTFPAPARYRIICVAYLLVLALPAIPLVSIAAIDVLAVDPATSAGRPVLTMPAAWWTSPAVAAGLWITWSAVHAVQFVSGVAAVRQAKRESRPCPVDLLARLPHWSQVHATGRPTRVVLSNHVRFAAVIGCGSPVIALAPSLIEQLSAADLDRVLVHEWAHVQRRDDVMQFVQQITRAVVGWHPAAWWLERQLEFEREAACDQVAVAITGSAKRYAACLTALAVLPHPSVRSLPALAAVSPSGLRRRLVRILALPSARTTPPRRAATLCADVALAALALAVTNVRAVAPETTWTAAQMVAPPEINDRAVIEVSATFVAAVPATPRVQSDPAPVLRPDRPSPSAALELDVPRPDAEARPNQESAPTMLPAVPLQSQEWTAGVAVAQPSAPPPAAAPWTVASDAGIAIGKSSRTAGIATAGFFTRVGKKIAASF
jgi:beta-lactamase regulating signal transducer with metallopeptidase domain